MAKSEKQNGVTMTIAPPNMQTAEFVIVGTAPYVQHKFGARPKKKMHDKQAAGPTAKKGAKREPKDFQQIYKDAMHSAEEGWRGIPASAFRCAMVSACRLCGFQMTKAKLAVFVEADGYSGDDATPLIRITKGKPVYHETAVRLATGVIDLAARPMWKPGWEAKVRIRFDADMFTLEDVANLLARVGMQVGIGEGRPDSKQSTGMGWGLFVIKGRD